ncbi:cation channel family transporter [Tuber indicum]|nr:cation channel family transporter [Tuber indicum]
MIDLDPAAMLSSLLRSGEKGRIEHSPFSSAYGETRSDCFQGHTVVDRGDGGDNDDNGSDDDVSIESSSIVSSGDEENENNPLLPIFSAAQLDSIPVYTLVHSIRSDIISRVDTSLTWDQLRSPQVSSFLVKPILSSLMRGPNRLSKGILYSLMANCLQFSKEAYENPGIAAVSKTRALLAEILAVKLLKEFTNRELIDALSYDFYPLQGMPPPAAPEVPTAVGHISFAPAPIRLQRASRISALEIAVRAQAKKFLSHPLVMKQLEAIWTGNIVFHSALDQAHRIKQDKRWPSPGGLTQLMSFRRAATVYDACDASLFKLSRLRVPRYKHITSTFSLAILLLLYVMVLVNRSYEITILEAVFWVWSFGFMMDEIAGFTEAGVSLYFMSLWNSFDMGIYLLFTAFYVLRFLGIIIPGKGNCMTSWSYDILASCAVFLFPRIFSVLDHYRYFSQLIIAFKIMAVDMVSLLVLILISCSGFFVAFTSFARDSYSAREICYALFQILMGFTPAAWESWESYNLLGKALLSAFLIICHFLIVTILITVLTNSFAAVAANSQEEHQFLVAVNTLSLVKSDSLFSYTAPLNLLGWVLHPLRHVMPFRQFVRLNRTVIKITHFPILLLIFLYERTILGNSIFEHSDVFSKKRTRRTVQESFDPLDQGMFNSVSRRIRAGSVASHHQDRALDEVFRRPYKGELSIRSGRKMDVPGGVVTSWMKGVVSPTGSPPTEFEDGFNIRNRAMAKGRSGLARFTKRDSYGTIEDLQRNAALRKPTRSVISDPEEFTNTGEMEGLGAFEEGHAKPESLGIIRTDGDDGDDEANSRDEEDEEEITNDTEGHDYEAPSSEQETDKENTPTKGAPTESTPGLPKDPSFTKLTQQALRKQFASRNHVRTNSSQTIKNAFNPAIVQSSEDELERVNPVRLSRQSSERTAVWAMDNASSGKKHSPRSSRPQTATRARAITTPRKFLQSLPNLEGLHLMVPNDEHVRSPSPILDLAQHPEEPQLPSSFATQMAMATGARSGVADLMLGRMVLSRIGNLEESMKDMKLILHEVKKLNNRGREKPRSWPDEEFEEKSMGRSRSD